MNQTLDFRPAYPPRLERPLPVWRQFVGEMRRNPLLNWPQAAFEEPYWFRRIATLRYHLVNDPDAIGHVLLTNAGGYAKPRIVKRLFRSMIGEGLFLADGESWKDQRRLMAPVFTPGAVAEFAPIFLDVAGRSADRWAQQSEGRIDASAEAVRATFDVIGQALFSGETALTSDEASAHIHAALAGLAEYRPGVLFGAPWLDRSPTARRGQAGQKYLLARLTEFIRTRQADPDPPADFMSRIIEAFAKTRSPEQAAKLTLDNAVTFLVAGHETTANAITWSLYLLSRAPTVQERAATEAMTALAAGGGASEIAARLPYVRMVLEEAMRLYPPVHRIEREALADDVICGHRVRKGDMVSIWPWVVHRHTALWRDPDGFDPENFSPEAKAGHHRFQYIPFGAGPRVCIGAQFAMIEGALILASWLARFRFSPDRDHQVFPTADVSLRPQGGLPLQVALRD
ncbi:cytochrome P450 [Phenylobacterium sp.]|uniref:cytochrome P450 n=1 Tax=Phenylobacterium sp. TaxID=1871053 RepID=UPI0028989981|nr:cytochrome P450 [Phenylobacterium sp.]